MESEHYLLNQAARLVGIKHHQLAYLIVTGAVEEPKLRIGGRRVFTPAEVERIRCVVAERASRKGGRS